MVTNKFKDAMAAYLLGNQGYAPTHIGFGEGGGSDSHDFESLTNAFFKPISSVTREGNVIVFNTFATMGEGNTRTIREVGLFTANGTLIARKRLPVPLVKNTAIRFEMPFKLNLDTY